MNTKRFFQTALTYFVGNILSKLVTFFLIPLYTNKLLPEEYGSYDLIVTVITLLVAITFFQIWDGMFRISFEYKEEKDKYSIICDSLAVYAVGILFYSLLFFIILKNFRFDCWEYVYLYGILSGLQSLYSFMARVFLKNRLFVISGTVNTLTVALCNIFLILYLHYGIKSLYLSQIIGCLFQIVIIEHSLKVIHRVKFKNINLERIKLMLKYSLPLCVATISYWLLSGYTKLVINLTLGAYENGIYAIACSLSNAAVIAINIFQFAWNEAAYMMAHEPDRSKVYIKCVNLLFITVCFGCAIICIIIKMLFPHLVGAEYRRASDIIPVLMTGISANAIAGFLGTLFMTEKQTLFILTSSMAASIFNFIISYPMTRIFGIYGAVISLTFSFYILLMLRLKQLKNRFSVSISRRALMSVCFVISGLLVYHYVKSNIMLGGYVIILGCAYIFLVERVLQIRIIKLLKLKNFRSN